MEIHGRSVLIIDDDLRTRDALTHLVRFWGCHALGASSLADGLALLDKTPECIILDLGLPDGCGEQVLREVRARRLPCRVVVCSGETDLDLLERLKGLGADAILVKPVDPDELVKACLGSPKPTESPITHNTTAAPLRKP